MMANLMCHASSVWTLGVDTKMVLLELKESGTNEQLFSGLTETTFRARKMHTDALNGKTSLICCFRKFHTILHHGIFYQIVMKCYILMEEKVAELSRCVLVECNFQPRKLHTDALNE